MRDNDARQLAAAMDENRKLRAERETYLRTRILKLKAEGLRSSEICEAIGCSTSLVRRIIQEANNA